MDKIKIAIVDDQRLFREGMASLLEAEPDFDPVIALYENGRACIEALPGVSPLPQVMLVDMDMPEVNGAELTTHLQQHYPSIKVIILTVYDQERFVINMIEAGACGYLLKNCDIEEVVNAIKTAHKSGYYFNDSFMNAMKNRAKYKSASIRNINNIPIELTDREKEVLLLICNEFTNIEIGEQLHISARTVDGHRNNLLAKTGSRNTAGLVLFAVTNNLLQNLLF